MEQDSANEKKKIEETNISPTVNEKASHEPMENEDDEDLTKNEPEKEEKEVEEEEKPKPVGQRFLVFCDSHPSSFRNNTNNENRAMKAAMKKADKSRDLLIVVNFFSSWDLLNDEKNSGKGSLYQQQSYAEAEGFRVKSIQRPSSSIYNDCVASILEFKVHQVFIGNQTFQHDAGETNIVFNAFSSLRKVWSGTVVEYILQNAAKICPITVVP